MCDERGPGGQWSSAVGIHRAEPQLAPGTLDGPIEDCATVKQMTTLKILYMRESR